MIKKSISAIESICLIILNEEKGTLGVCLKKLGDENVKIHPALRKAFEGMYGYTSDKSEIGRAHV